MDLVIGLILFIVCICIYLLPAIVAGHRKTKRQTAILLLNFLLGWTFIVWVGALIWALCEEEECGIL